MVLGKFVSRTDARGVVTDYTWDALNRLTAIEYPAFSHAHTSDFFQLSGTAPIIFYGFLNFSALRA